MPKAAKKRRSKRKTLASAEERIRPIIRRLKQVYPDAKCSLDHKNARELLVATILSAQCTDDRVNKVTKPLFKKYRRTEDYAVANPAVFEEDIKATGFYRNKTKSIIAMAQGLVEEHGSKVPKSMEELTALPGVGRKTANVVLGTAYGIPSGIVVDTHVSRISRLLGLTKQKDPNKIETDLAKIIPRKDWILFSHLMIYHGRAVCIARRPRCTECVLADLCPSAKLD